MRARAVRLTNLTIRRIRLDSGQVFGGKGRKAIVIPEDIDQVRAVDVA